MSETLIRKVKCVLDGDCRVGPDGGIVSCTRISDIRTKIIIGGKRVPVGIGFCMPEGHHVTSLSNLPKCRFMIIQVVSEWKFCYSIEAEPLLGPWCSGLAHPPVTRKIVGSNPIGPALELCWKYFGWICMEILTFIPLFLFGDNLEVVKSENGNR